HDHLGERGPRSQRGDQRGRVAGLVLGGLGGAGALPPDRRSLRRIAGASGKVRVPRTTNTAVGSGAPRRRRAPRHGREEESRPVSTEEVMSAWESKAPWWVARRPPARVSRAATTAIGR